MKQIIRFTQKHGLIVALIVEFVIFTILNPAFISLDNIMLVLRQVSIVGIIACGMTLVLIGGNFDLSVGSLITLTANIAVSLLDPYGPLVAVSVALLVGLLSGLLSGMLVAHLKLNSMIVTLGMMSILQALSLIYTGGRFLAIVNQNTWYSFIANGFISIIPFPIVLYSIIIVIFMFLLNKTVYGRELKAVGSNIVASRYSGINEKKVILFSFISTGILSAIAGILMSSRVMGAQNTMGQGYEFQVITAVILGGTSLYGGEGSIIKTVIGVLILGFLFNGFIMIGLPYYFQWFAQWFIIVGAVWLDVISKRKDVGIGQ